MLNFFFKLTRAEKKALKDIKKFNIDWKNFYSVNNIQSNLDPSLYFVLNVKSMNLIVPNVLDVQFYLQKNPDVIIENINPLVHYLKYGIGENRIAFPLYSEDEKHYDFQLLKRTEIDWAEYKETYNLVSDESAVSHYIHEWHNLKPIIKNVFNTAFYLKQNKDVQTSLRNPLVHFLTEGRSEGRQGLENSVIKQDKSNHCNKTLPLKGQLEIILDKCNVKWDTYKTVNNFKENISSPLEHFLGNFESMKIIIPNLFDPELYLELYPDLLKANVNTYVHFLLHGMKEGRIGFFNVESHYKLGKVKYRPDLANYVVVSHESSATGAPLVGYNLSKELLPNYNVFNVVLKKSKLQLSFENDCVASISNLEVKNATLAKKALQFIQKEFGEITGVICNSVETECVLQAANKLNIPTVSLVHEFSEYTRPIGKITNTVFYADRLVVPANAIKESIIRELKKYSSINVVPSNIVVQPQGSLPFIPEGHGELDSVEVLKTKLSIENVDDYNILIGAGYVQIRKGVDLFISAAKKIKEISDKPCKFVWVGEGYSPQDDLGYSNWLETQITINNLVDDVVFLGHQRNLNNIMQLADVFCLTSRLDPFPNVVIDALTADVHVACFDQSTGCAEFLLENSANATVCDYLDIEQYANGVATYLNGNERFINKNKALVAEKLNFKTYTKFIEQELAKASEFSDKANVITKHLEKQKIFNTKFYNPSLEANVALKRYVELGLKGIHLHNPAPGFNEFKWLQDNSNHNPYVVPLFEANTDKLLSTHNVIKVAPKQSIEAIDFKYAVHIHLFYPDLAREFALYLANLPKGFDVLITHLNENDASFIMTAFEHCGADNIKLMIVPNKGRDIAPFINMVNEEFKDSEYEVIGHFHSKKSLEVGGDLGDKWRSFLMQTLVGKETAKLALSAFNNPEVGLLFAEDRHCVDSGMNKPHIEELYSVLGIKASADCHLFPLGTMFWARTKAIMPLLQLDLDKYMQEEPLPYDGSYLHAIERIIPEVAKSTGYKMLTIHNQKTNW